VVTQRHSLRWRPKGAFQSDPVRPVLSSSNAHGWRTGLWGMACEGKACLAEIHPEPSKSIVQRESDGKMIGDLITLEAACLLDKRMVRPERFELPTYWFVASRSIQLS
jgi:hypothetical protein